MFLSKQDGFAIYRVRHLYVKPQIHVLGATTLLYIEIFFGSIQFGLRLVGWHYQCLPSFSRLNQLNDVLLVIIRPTRILRSLHGKHSFMLEVWYWLGYWPRQCIFTWRLQRISPPFGCSCLLRRWYLLRAFSTQSFTSRGWTRERRRVAIAMEWLKVARVASLGTSINLVCKWRA